MKNELNEVQERFADWLLTDPRDPSTQREWAAQNGVNERTVKRWKADPRFIEHWEAKAREKNISVDRVQSVVDSLHAAAVTGDVKAASLYLQYVDRFTPKKIVVTEDRETKLMTDEQLEAELRELLSADAEEV